MDFLKKKNGANIGTETETIGKSGMNAKIQQYRCVLLTKRPSGVRQKRILVFGACAALCATIASILLFYGCKVDFIMRKKMRYAVGFVLICFGFGVSGQTPTVQKEVLFQTSTSKTYAVPCDANVDSLSMYDSINLEAQLPLVRQAEHVIENGWLTIIQTYPQQPYYDKCYGFRMGKSVTDKLGTRLYDHNGDEYSNWENEVENETFAVTAEDILGYGFFNSLFAVSIDEVCNQLDSMAIPFQLTGQKLLVTYEDVDREEIIHVETDFEQLYLEKRVFEYGILSSSDKTEYQRVDEWIIPVQNKQVYFDVLPSGIRYQTTQTETYQSYKVVSGDEVLVDWTEQIDPPFAITVTPNPADEYIIVYFSPPIEETASIAIKNTDNDIVWEMDFFAIGALYTIDITALESGIYTVFCTYENQIAEDDFLKVETDSTSTASGIQIIPNPAQNSIMVVFPSQINAMTTVIITDMAGTVYFNLDMFVADNTLSIDIDFLPAGIYNINFINDDSTTNAKFIKQ